MEKLLKALASTRSLLYMNWFPPFPGHRVGCCFHCKKNPWDLRTPDCPYCRNLSNQNQKSKENSTPLSKITIFLVTTQALAPRMTIPFNNVFLVSAPLRKQRSLQTSGMGERWRAETLPEVRDTGREQDGELGLGELRVSFHICLFRKWLYTQTWNSGVSSGLQVDS